MKKKTNDFFGGSGVVFETLLFNKLLLSQAKEDSLYPGEGQIEDEIDRRLRYFIQQFGSTEKLEEFYEKSVDEIRIEFHDQSVRGEVGGHPRNGIAFFHIKGVPVLVPFPHGTA